ncbi:hypothetical protein [Coleofasciculus sp.]|uniref:hypothetical protein n=1 Tax=Coleofasciculus sp. TaxID=3100458 RepID=UPI0039FA42FF
MNKWLILLISEDIKLGYKWAMQIRSLYRSEEIEPILTSIDDSEGYLKQRNVALCILELSETEPGRKLRQLNSLIRFYKLDCELLVIHGSEDDQVLRAVRDCGGKLLKRSDSPESPELLELLKKLIAKRTGASYRELADSSAKLARLEERISASQDRLAEILASLGLLNDCLFGGPNHTGWDRRLDRLEEQNSQLEKLLEQVEQGYQSDMAVFKNQMGFLFVRSILRLVLVGGWNWILENPFKFAGMVVGFVTLAITLIFN